MSGNSNLKIDPGKYASERFFPKVPVCSKSIISLLFDGKSLVMTVAHATKKVYRYSADSGKPDGSGRFDYSQPRQKKPFEGPIPVGKYWIDPSEFWENAWYKFGASTASWGEYRITIHPYPTTQTHSRGGFFIHGGSTRGSAGCIDLTNKIAQFYLDLHRELNGNSNCYIELVVSYK